MKSALAVDQIETHRVALTGHCYRMLGSASDADDAVQETMVRAWRGLDRFDGRAALSTWLHRIATNVCLDALKRRRRRERPISDGPIGTVHDELRERPREHWLEPIPDRAVIPEELDPERRVALEQSVRLAFVAALQHLPPKQRAVLLLREVVGWSAQEVAEALDTSVAAANSALQRARATMSEKGIDPSSPHALDDAQKQMLDRYVAAFHDYDVAALTSLLREDAVLSMPPFTLWLEGPDTIGEWFLGRGIGCRGSRLVPTKACGSPAFGQYRLGPDGHHPWSLVVLELDGDRIASMTHFLDTETLFPRFGLPARV